MHSKNGCIAFFLFFLLITPSFNGIQWSRNLSKPFSIDTGMAIEKIGNDYIAVVKSEDLITNEWYCRIIKLKENGWMQWEKSFVSDDSEYGICISNGIFVLYSYEGKANLVRIGSDGKMEWNKSFSFSFPVYSSPYVIEKDGKIIFCVYNGSIERKSILVKIDKDGSILWKKYFNYSVSIAKMENGYVVVETPLIYSRNYTMIYAFNYNDSLLWKRKINGIDYFAYAAINGFILQHDSRTFIKFDENGRQQWNKTFEKEIVITSCSIANDGYLMAGFKVLYPIPKMEGILIKLDKNGNEIWRKTYFMPRYNIGNIFLLYNAGFLDAKECNDGIIAMVEREADPNALFLYLLPLFDILIYLSFIKTDVFVVKI